MRGDAPFLFRVSRSGATSFRSAAKGGKDAAKGGTQSKVSLPLQFHPAATVRGLRPSRTSPHVPVGSVLHTCAQAGYGVPAAWQFREIGTGQYDAQRRPPQLQVKLAPGKIPKRGL